MKTFKDLDFQPHSNGKGIRARMDFKNGYGVSVVFGELFYSNGIDTYELAVMIDGETCSTTEIVQDVLGYITEKEVTDAMIKIQELL